VWSKDHRRRAIAVVAGIAIVLGAGAAYLIASPGFGSRTVIVTTAEGTGGGEAGGAAPTTRQIRSAVSSYADALASANGHEVCALMSPAARHAYVQSMSAFAKGSCQALVRASLSQAPAASLASLRHATVGEIQVSGGSGSATLAAGGQSVVVPVVRTDRRWLLSPAPGVLTG
jgi:hypothetical protein